MNKNKRTALIVALAVLFMAALTFFFKAVAMYQHTQKKLDEILAYTASQTNVQKNPELTLFINEMPLTITLTNEDVIYDCPTLNTEFDTVISTKDKNHEITVNDQPLKDGTISFKLDAISQGDHINVNIDGTDYYLRTLPDEFPPVTAMGQSSQNGYYYTTLGSYVVKFDSKGAVVFYRRANVTNTGPFRRYELDGQVVYAYLEIQASDTYIPLANVGYRQTALVMLNEQYHKIDQVPYMAVTDKIPSGYPLENHDYMILDKNHYILTTYVGKRVNNIPPEVNGSEYGANVVACIFQEIKDGECIFQWDSTDYPQLYAASREAGDYTNTLKIWADYAHFNAITIDPKDNNFLCSFRDLDSIVKIDRKTGEILWVLGGDLDEFNLTPEQQFRRQHNVSVTEDGSILLFDNGCLTNVLGYPVQTAEEKAAVDSKQISRGLKLTLDEEKKTVTDFKEYRMENFFSATMGSIQLLDDETDTVLFGWGGRSRTGMPLFQEVNCKDKIVNFELICNDSDINCYRVAYFEK